MSKNKILFLLALVIFPIFGCPTASRAETLSISAFILGKGKCTIATPADKNLYLNFGDLDPLSPSSADTHESVTFTVRCVGIPKKNEPSTVVVSRQTGGPLTLKHTTPSLPDLIPYSLGLPTSVPVYNNTPTSITVTGTISREAYRLASVGAYRDTVLLDILP